MVANLLQVSPVFAASALALVLALVVLRRGWEDRRHQLLALLLFFLALSWGGFAMSTAIRAAGGPEADELFWLGYSYLWFPGLPLAVLALALATRRGGASWWSHPAVVCVAASAYAVASAIRPELYGPDPSWGGGPAGYFTWGVTSAMGIVPLVLLRRSRRASDDAERESHLLLAVGIAASTVFHASRELLRFVTSESARPTLAAAWGPATFFLVYALTTVAFVALLWVASVRSQPAARGQLRVAAWLLSFEVASGFAAYAAVRGLLGLPAAPAQQVATSLWAVWMFASPAILAYAILRGKVLGLDRRVRRGVRRGTIASAFVAVFFVASEGAQQVFAVSAGPWIGLLAAGALVFAIAPLQRVAERVAEAAVPPVAAPSPVVAPSKEEAYRNALRLALRDRTLTREEELHLMHLADELGLTARRALELRHEVEAAASVRVASRPTADDDERNAEEAGSPGAAQ